MMMKPIKCKKLAVFRVSSPPRCPELPEVPFTHNSNCHLCFDASRDAPLQIAAASDSANTSGGINGNREAQNARVLTQSISPVSCAVIASRSSLIRAAFDSSFSYRELFIIVSNISSFDEYAGRVFALLYESLPIPVDLTIGDIIGQQDLYMHHGIPDEMVTECEIASYTIQWLASAGYLSMQAGNGNDFFQSGSD
ncbi:hypothetical protein IM311_19460 [Enterobacter cloacae complex sp. P40RS]|uniref:Uncharacterized protein n=1 Tax=Enterobacter pasteurii TaxID=3029761 RepID=A0ABR9QBN7_9ENTR|nr:MULTISPECIES: hypothetical protein [Enterobacter cloacae complex]MBE4856245.1 hypothetical protein [Enterobacter pasteurii]MBE4863831.1 hypothetical protein [Enterobacter cloacae complex sp. P40C2]MBE4875945.1 hypothetical protein [Enterobacter cloacae complex sp. P40C]